MDKTYHPKDVEPHITELWERKRVFCADPAAGSNTYCIVIPPPNVTAALHLGHALNNTLQDVLVRWKRMCGFNTLWMPGTDHAGIATQTVVEKRILSEEGKRRTDFDRDEFVARVQSWKDEYEGRILGQLKAMGCSCDWDRTRFTMDEVCAKAVRAAFFKLFADGLIYRGKRLVNWDPATQTVLADDEVEHETVQGHFWYLRYPLVESSTGGSSGTDILSVRPTGVPPVAGSGGMDVPSMRPTGVPPVADDVSIRQGAYLPHWTKEGGIYFVTFRLADSLPASVLEGYRREREEMIERARAQRRELTRHERKELAELFTARVDSLLDAGQGSCAMNDSGVAQVVRDALLHFDGDRYDILAWCVMPNHVHAVMRPRHQHKLSKILQSWKSFSAKEANRILDKTGQVWQEEYYDHLIRDEDELNQFMTYVFDNPARAGLRNWTWVGGKSATEVQNLFMQGQDIPATHGQDARATIAYVTVATTRPETMLGDTAVAMNPADPRAKYLVGRKVRLPIVGREIPIIADEHVVLPDRNSTDEKARFSTGFLKVTPAHDPDDWAIGQRHDLPVINVMAPDGTISDKHGWDDCTTPEAQNLIGMDRFEAREAVVEFFRQQDLLEDVRDYTHEVGHSYRSHVPIEPYLSDQWFIAVKQATGSRQQATGSEQKATGSEQKATGSRQQATDSRQQATGNGQEATGAGATAALSAAVPASERTEARDGVTYIAGTDVPANSLAGLALLPLLNGELRFVPDRYAGSYRAWLENLRDWPISRQLWWGHRIPVWRALIDTNSPEFAREAPGDWTHVRIAVERAFAHLAEKAGLKGQLLVRPSSYSPAIYFVCSQTTASDSLLDAFKRFSDSYELVEVRPGQEMSSVMTHVPGFEDATEASHELMNIVLEFTRDPDVLDTWFSSALWPISTMGWPDETDLLKAFYPSDVLCTAREIITLWVSRMVMFGQYFRGQIPFPDVYIHAMIQDGAGRKMSKSLGNGIDPLDIIASHGADAMRFTLCYMTTETQDVRMPVEEMVLPDGRKANTSPKFDIGRNFCNKLWNAARFAMMNLDATPAWGEIHPAAEASDAWILSRLNATIRDVTGALEGYRYHEAAAALYRYMWNDFCDWYLEMAKVRIAAGDAAPKAVLAHALDGLLRLLHPMLPFVTECIWSQLNAVVPNRGPDAAPAEAILARAAWPRAQAEWVNPALEERFALLQQLISGIREARSRHDVPASRKVRVTIAAGADEARMVTDSAAIVQRLADVESLAADPAAEPGGTDATVIAGGLKAFVHDVIDRDAELKRLTGQAETLTKGVRGIEGKLANANFVAKAPPEVVRRERDRLAGLKTELEAVEKSLAALE